MRLSGFGLPDGLNKMFLRNEFVLRGMWKAHFPRCNVAFNVPPRIVPRVAVGDNTYSSMITLLLASMTEVSKVPLVIGKYCSIASEVVIELSRGHSTSDRALYPLGVSELRGRCYSDGGVSIGSDVWIGHGATVLSGVAIGDSSVIAAKSVVTHDVPSFSVVGGAPARIIRDRRQADWAEDPWWEWTDEQILKRMKELKQFMIYDQNKG